VIDILNWYAEHPILGSFALIVVCLTTASCFGSLSGIFRRRDRDEHEQG
jgi:hypothetical protein